LGKKLATEKTRKRLSPTAIIIDADFSIEDINKKFEKKKRKRQHATNPIVEGLVQDEIPPEAIEEIENKTILKGFQFNQETLEAYGEKLESATVEDLEFLKRLDSPPEDLLADLPENVKIETDFERKDMFNLIINIPYEEIIEPQNNLNVLLINTPISEDMAKICLERVRPKEDLTVEGEKNLL
jgi:hypothetical protein